MLNPSRLGETVAAGKETMHDDPATPNSDDTNPSPSAPIAQPPQSAWDDAPAAPKSAAAPHGISRFRKAGVGVAAIALAIGGYFGVQATASASDAHNNSNNSSQGPGGRDFGGRGGNSGTLESISGTTLTLKNARSGDTSTSVTKSP
jgi:hypothetical protein